MKIELFFKILKNIVLVFLGTIFLIEQQSFLQENIFVDYGSFNINTLEMIVNNSKYFKDEGEKIDYISEKFLGTNYEENTLTGDLNTPELFTVNLKGMDCYTYIDYVEALRISNKFDQFENSIQMVRYQSAEVDFKKRNHFFSDWAVYNIDRIKDVTKEVGGDRTKTIIKYLNKKSDGTLFLPGISVVERKISYILSGSIDKDMLKHINTGDYAGIYTDRDGLDVSHAGIIIKKNDKYYLRHATSKDVLRKVVDEDLIEYLKNKKGLLIFRAI